MKQLLLLLSLILIIVCVLTSSSFFIEASCKTGQGVPLQYQGSTSNILPGFYAKNLDLTNSSTFAIACVPTAECQIKRSLSSLCSPQSPFEPQLCGDGKYCPNATTQLECPEGYYCPFGVFEPYKCPPVSICNAGAERPVYLGSLIVMIVIFGLVIVAIIWYQYRALPTPMEKIATATLAQKKKILNKAMRRARVETGITEPLRFELKDLCVSVKEDGKDEPKKILEGLSAIFQPRMVSTVLGASGAGKTTAFKAALRKFNNDKFIVTGENKINGTSDPAEIAKFQSSIAYVPQDDVLEPSLSVYDNVFYTSELALPQNWNREDRDEFREVILSLLGLSRLRNVRVSELHGGEKKKCAIACQLSGAPAAIFLDEPTSGLDSFTSRELVDLLKLVAVTADVTVVLVAHQPRREIFFSFQSVLLLGVTPSGGQTVYEGPVDQAAKVMGEFLTIRPQDNPGDIILDAVAIHGEAMVEKWKSGEWPAMIEEQKKKNDASAIDETEEDPAAKNPLTGTEKSSADDTTAAVEKSVRQATFLRQFFLMHTRALQKMLANYQFLLLEWLILFLTGLILGSAGTLAQPEATFKGQYSRISPDAIVTFLPQYFMYIHYSGGLASSVSGVKIFGDEKIRFKAEADAGFSVTAYFLANSLVTLYRCFVSSLVFTSIIHVIGQWTMGYWIFFANVFLSYTAIGTVGAIVSLLTTMEYAAVVASTLSLVYGALSGFITFPFGLKALSYAYWSAHSMYINWYEVSKHIVDPPYDRWDYKPEEFDDAFCIGILFLMYAIYTFLVWLILQIQHRK